MASFRKKRYRSKNARKSRIKRLGKKSLIGGTLSSEEQMVASANEAVNKVMTTMCVEAIHAQEEAERAHKNSKYTTSTRYASNEDKSAYGWGTGAADVQRALLDLKAYAAYVVQKKVCAASDIAKKAVTAVEANVVDTVNTAVNQAVKAVADAANAVADEVPEDIEKTAWNNAVMALATRVNNVGKMRASVQVARVAGVAREAAVAAADKAAAEDKFMRTLENAFLTFTNSSDTINKYSLTNLLKGLLEDKCEGWAIDKYVREKVTNDKDKTDYDFDTFIDHYNHLTTKVCNPKPTAGGRRRYTRRWRGGRRM
jgi:hypothetical protein